MGKPAVHQRLPLGRRFHRIQFNFPVAGQIEGREQHVPRNLDQFLFLQGAVTDRGKRVELRMKPARQRLHGDVRPATPALVPVRGQARGAGKAERPGCAQPPGTLEPGQGHGPGGAGAARPGRRAAQQLRQAVHRVWNARFQHTAGRACRTEQFREESGPTAGQVNYALPGAVVQ